ncbi:hypothetical protein [Roseovarius sp.]|uniref:hypothetical protein n=1 Tax=Roseovarius sp. TaxID=1486281 RepID=UPI0035616581
MQDGDDRTSHADQTDHTDRPLTLADDDLARIAEKVSVLMQLDRTYPNIPTQVDMQALANVPAYLSSVFEQANQLNGELTPAQIYELVNRRIADLQAQLYLIRMELDNRFERDPAKIYEDPLVISAYGERLKTQVRSREFGFEPSLIAHGWYPSESLNGDYWRWMRPGRESVVCLPHLGRVDQVIEIQGYVIDPAQLSTLEIVAEASQAELEIVPKQPASFVAKLTLTAAQLHSTNLLPVEFRMDDFRQPNSTDSRLLGACIVRFACRPADDAAQAPE